MGNLQTAIDTLLRAFKQIGGIFVAVLTEFEYWLRDQLNVLGVPHTLQTVILVAVAVLLVLGALRLFGGVIRIVVVLILVLLVINIVLPIIHG